MCYCHSFNFFSNLNNLNLIFGSRQVQIVFFDKSKEYEKSRVEKCLF